MKTEKFLLAIVVIILTLSVITPFIVFAIVHDKATAGQIGDALGGTSAPFVNISAILIVIITYIYQRRSDKKNTEKELTLEMFNNLKVEFSKVTISETKGSGADRKETHLYGRDALVLMVRYLNEQFVKLEDFEEWDSYKAILQILNSMNKLLDFIKQNEYFTSSEVQLFNSQVALFYQNNLYIDQEKRGNKYCEYHRRVHEFPELMKSLMVSIEAKTK